MSVSGNWKFTEIICNFINSTKKKRKLINSSLDVFIWYVVCMLYVCLSGHWQVIIIIYVMLTQRRKRNMKAEHPSTVL